MAVKLIIADGRPFAGDTFLARVEIIDNVIRFYAPNEPEPRRIHPGARVVKVEIEGLRMTVGGLTTVTHGHPDPQVRGRQTIYREWLLQPRWESDYARDNRMMLPSERAGQT